MTNLFSTEGAMEAAHQALQIHGIYDIKSAFAIVRGFGDAKVLKIVESACEMERTIIWRELLAQ
ncbi:hypothetical protein IVB05_09235 [Bradyrhizobium sp. 170]|nr:hypothetical protein IVB05_09235 [Bradyrhizobium sp. 170]